MENIEKAEISICIANYNGEKVITPCIESVLSQQVNARIEVLVHDDASTDGSLELIGKNFPQVRCIKSEENIGFCKSNNKLARIASGKYLLFLNNDAVLLPGALSVLLHEAINSGKDTILGLPHYNMESDSLIDLGSKFDLFLNPVPNLKSNNINIGMVVGACLWIPRTLWDEIGGFPDWYSILSEDLYLCLIAYVWGYEVKIVNTSGFKHWVGHSLGGGKLDNGKLVSTYKRRRFSERNKTFTMVLCYPLPLLLPVLPIHIILLLVEAACLVVLKRDKKFWKDIYAPAIMDLWKERNRLLKERKKIHRKNTLRFRDFISVFVWYPYKLKMLIKFGLPRLT